MQIALVSDSTSDIPPSIRKELGVRIVPLYVNFEGKVYKDWEEISPTDIFSRVKNGADLPATSQPSPQDFEAAFAEALDNGSDHVLSINISSKLSGTVQSARIAAENFPGKVTVFDSLAASAGIGMMVLRARELLDQGKGLEEVISELERIRDDHIIRFMVATLEYLRKNGRIGGAEAFLGNLLNIKPILTVKNGIVDGAGRARGEKRALKEMVKTFKEWSSGRERVRVFFLYTGAEAAVQNLKGEILALDGTEEVYTSEIGAVIASHVGPGIFGYYAYSL
ncbi:DegV family protein [Oceanithermus sp.]